MIESNDKLTRLIPSSGVPQKIKNAMVLAGIRSISCVLLPLL
jgi:hypothetical protein